MGPRHMSEGEVCKVEELQKAGWQASAILQTLQKTRRKAGELGPSLSGVYRAMSGQVYKRGATEQRGRPTTLPRQLLSVANQERLRLIDEAENEFLVTWLDIYKATKAVLKARGILSKRARMPSLDWFTKTVRANSEVRARHGKRRITHEKDYKDRRVELAKRWVKYPQSWWETEIHAYIDNKTFVIPRTQEMKKRMRTQRVTHHLRTPAEGSQESFILPKRGRSLVGIPSVEITAAVAQDRIILWRENQGRWNGASAASMYEDLGNALRAHYGDLPFFRVVEDGDTKGYQSNKGIKAKQTQKIHSWTLPPHSPGLMPLDYSLWNDIEGRVLAKRRVEDESLSSFKKRLRMTAKRFPASAIKKCLGKMRENLKTTVDSNGGHTYLD